MNTIAHQVTEVVLLGGERIFIARTGAKNLVAIQGSVLGGSSSLPKNKTEAPTIVAELLDAGVPGKKKDEIRDSLASRGATLCFNNGIDRMSFSASCFPEDVSFVLALIAECVGHAVLPPSEVKTVKQRILGEFEEMRTKTNIMAADALSRSLFSLDHVNYVEPIEHRIRNVKDIERSDARSFMTMLGRRGLILAVVGDVNVSSVRKAAEKAFGALTEGSIERNGLRPNTKQVVVSEQIIPIKDKANIDTFFGTALPFTYADSDYVPFTVLSSMLGGRGLSTGHLMRTIRERDGYTYGIRSQQVGFLENTHGAFRVWATFSPHNFQEAVAATRKEIDIFLKSGITEASLATKKDEMTGNYLVGLSTTRGLATALHLIGTEGRSLSYLDEYPEHLRMVSVRQLKDLAPLIASKKLSMAASGTFPKK